MTTYKTRDPSHLIGGTKSGKTTIPIFFLNQLLKDEIEKKNIITKKILKEKIEINRMRVKFEEEKKREGG